MDIVNTFKDYLLTSKNPPSKITIKNYLADVRRFVNWYNKSFANPFTPEHFTSSVIAAYRTDLQSVTQASLPAARSAKRYISSLRKFGAFLKHSGAIEASPFETEQQKQGIADPLYLKEFNNFLFTEHASKLTIKNYVTDIKQFLDWLGKVESNDTEKDTSSLFSKIDNLALEQYKMRLLNEVKLSPISINRKLSSLRRYIRWLTDRSILSPSVAVDEMDKHEPLQALAEQTKPVEIQLPLTSLQGLAEKKEQEKQTKYSRLAPIRLLQKITKIITLCTDLLFFNPIAEAAENIQYTLWKSGKKKIFAPINTILESSSYVREATSVKTIIPKQTSMLPPLSDKTTLVLHKVMQLSTRTTSDTVHNFTKALYAPLQLSTKHMHWQQKFLYHLRFTRPEWYIKYHTFSVVHYIHLAVMVLATVIAGAGLYQTWHGSDKQKQAVLAAQSTAPPRTLSFQGRLLDKTNAPLTAETSLRFTIYNSPTATGAAMLWQEKQSIKPNQNGYFNTVLGKKMRLMQNIFTDNPSLYVGISVNNNEELSPRQQIPTSSYAANSQTVQGLKPITESSNATKNVLLALDSMGNLTIGGSASPTFQATGGQFNLSGQTLLLTTSLGSNGNIKIAPDGSGIIDLQKPLQNTSNYNNPSGIPGAVEVDDVLSILATTSSQSALVINQNGPGDIISGNSHGVAKFRLDGEGNALIAGKLIINGNTIGTNSTSFGIANNNVTNLSIGNNATTISLGANSGMTSINNNTTINGTSILKGAVTASGLITANGGMAIAEGKSLTFKDFIPGAITYIDENHQVAQDSSHFSWLKDNKTLKVVGSLCIKSSDGSCGSTPGTIYASNATVQAADLAENYVSGQNLEPGDVVSIEGSTNSMAIVKSNKAYQPQLIGIVSTKPGFTLNSDANTDSNHPYTYPLALQGRIPVKISSANGAIQAGDDLTSSTIPGVAMKATASGQMIGKALEAYDAPEIGKITAFVNLSYHVSASTIGDNGNLAIATEAGKFDNTVSPSAGIVSSLATALINTESITTHSLNIASENISISGKTLHDYISTLATQIVNIELNKRGNKHTNFIDNIVASPSAIPTDMIASPSTTLVTSISGTLTSTKKSASASALIYNSIASTSALASHSALPNSFLPPTASNSGTLLEGTHAAIRTLPSDYSGGTIDPSIPLNNHYNSMASLSGDLSNFKSDFATFNQGLIALGPTSLTDVAVSNIISIDNNLKITANSLGTVGSDLNIQPLRQGAIAFMGGLVAIDTQGNLQVNGDANFAHNATVNGQLAAGIIAPIPDQDLAINLKGKSNHSGSSLLVTNASGSGVLQINQSGDVISSGAGKFTTLASRGFSIIRGAEADTSITESVSEGSAGKGLITAHEIQRTIYTPYVTEHSLIYVTATSNTQNAMPYLARQSVEDTRKGTKGSFTIQIPYPITKDVRFNWWIVN